MKLNTKLTALASAISLATLLTACGGDGSNSGGSTAGIGGSGITTSGTITGFGSVFVNGIKFETTNSEFNIEGTMGTQDDLAIGMVVQVNGILNDDGLTGTATSIIYDDDLQGPVENFVGNGLTATFTVLGITVKIDNKLTYFDDDNGSININTIANGDIVELSGFFDASDTLIASRIERKDDGEQAEMKGTITSLSGTTFILKGISVDASNARLEDLPNGLQNNIYVEVKGHFNGIQIIATKIESEELDFNDYDDDNKFEIEGFITHFNSPSDFKINGIRVNANSARLSPSRMQLTNNLQVEAEGRIVNGVLQASEIKMRGGEVEIQAFISAVDIPNNRFELSPVAGQPPIIVTVGPETQYEDDIRDTYGIRLTDLRVGDFIEIEGYQNDDNTIFAIEVEISKPDEVKVQGIIESNPSADRIKVLGVEFLINNATRFESNNDNDISQSEFNNRVTQNQSWVEVEDENHDGTADKVEIETR
ncbi:hypothetical protein MNBD_GAMMA03-1378 [hydrothermal vent metagenome]|uniref:DUF5666 domain-containing protein n=1 Tax=hydrothermal vent metagenome TaxID=652676 RepID=A0A3B0W8A5_9ZZZZ